MPATSSARLTGSAAAADLTATIPAFIDGLRLRGGPVEEPVRRSGSVARHFLVWLRASGTDPGTVEPAAVERFLRHGCRGRESCGSAASVRFGRWSRRRTCSGIWKFVRFPEAEGHVDTPGGLGGNLRLLDGCLGELRRDGYAAGTIRAYRHGCTGFIAWLHPSRIRLRDVTADTVGGYHSRTSVLSVSGVYRGRRRPKDRAACDGVGNRIEFRSSASPSPDAFRRVVKPPIEKDTAH